MWTWEDRFNIYTEAGRIRFSSVRFGSAGYPKTIENGSEQQIRHCMTRHVLVNVLAGFGAVLAVSGSLGGSISLFHFCCPCFLNERRQFRHFAGILRLFRVHWGKRPLSSIYVTRASSTNEDNLGTLLGFAAVSGSLGKALSLSLSISVVRGSSNKRRQFRHFAGICGCFGFVVRGAYASHTFIYDSYCEIKRSEIWCADRDASRQRWIEVDRDG